GEHRVRAEGHDEARKYQVVDEDAVRLVDAVAVTILMHRDAAVRIERAGAVGILHVAAQLDDEHAAVAVEGNLRRLFDVRLGEDRLHAEAGRQPELLLLLLWRQRQHGRLRREVGLERIRSAAAAGLALRRGRRATL